MHITGPDVVKTVTHEEVTSEDLGGAPKTPQQVVTNAVTGTYIFTNLQPGNYRIDETQPLLFTDGKDTPGNEGGANLDGDDGDNSDAIVFISLRSGENSMGYNFGELAPTLKKRRFLASRVGNHGPA